MAKRRRNRRSKPKFRASWRGQLRFGLVSFEVQAINAELKEKAEVHFHLLHEPDHKRIHFAKVCPKHGEVPNDEIVEGYEYAKGKYVEFEKEELDLLRTEEEKALTVDSFIGPEDFDPIYFDGRMYYLMPSGPHSSEPYALLEAAMEKKNRWAIGQVVFSGREQLAVVRPLDGVLSMAMLSYDAEIRKPSEIKSEFSRPRTTASKLRLAEDLISKWHDGKFDYSTYKDRYRQKVKAAIAAKKKGVEIGPPEEEEEPEVINLMDALKRSVAESKRGRHKSRTKRTSHAARKRRA
ncbi:MAG TPA: Ku protein [Lacipirellulaceae bacterium]|nr:Ku protein [Lacipirellulaceae bacterium]